MRRRDDHRETTDQMKCRCPSSNVDSLTDTFVVEIKKILKIKTEISSFRSFLKRSPVRTLEPDFKFLV